jgi:uncharacterized damage-inducible protein DinB
VWQSVAHGIVGGMTPADLLTDAFGRIRDGVHQVLADLDDDALTARPGADANTIGWLVWHLLRIQDDHVADVAGTGQVWTSQGYADRAALPFHDGATGFGQSTEQVGQVRVDAGFLGEYADAVTDATLAYLATIGPDDLDRVVDESWDPPVTLAVRLVSVIGDDLQHLGQAAYAKGLLARAS